MTEKKQVSAHRSYILVRDIVRSLKKDILIETRNRIALNLTISFAVITTLSLSLVAAGVPFSPRVQAILLWLVMFFSAMSGLSFTFVREIEQGTDLFLRLHVSAESIFISKLVFNIMFFFMTQGVIAPLFIIFLQVRVHAVPLFIGSLLTGGFAVAAVTTILAAMVARAGGKGSLFTAISFPVMVPVLWTLISTTETTLTAGSAVPANNLLFLLAFSGAVVAISFLLFPIIWLD